MLLTAGDTCGKKQCDYVSTHIMMLKGCNQVRY